MKKRYIACLFFSVAGMTFSTTACASLAISSAPTQNVTCSAGICTAATKNASLNAGDLASMLADGDVRIVSGSLAKDINVDAPLSWTSAHRLTFDSYRSIAFNAPVVVAGAGGLTITTNDGGSSGDFRFFKKGHVEFWDLASGLIINGNSYKLENKLKTLARDIHRNGVGNYALAKDLNEKRRQYIGALIPVLSGTIEGLGNSIANLTITTGADSSPVALIGYLSSTGTRTIRDIGLDNVNVTGTGSSRCAGALVGMNSGTVANAYVTGRVAAPDAQSVAGGLVCNNQFGTIIRSHSGAAVSASMAAGGLAGESIGADDLSGIVQESYATGTVTGGDGAMVGGLVGNNWGGTIADSYATGSAAGGVNAFVGGLIGSNSDNIQEQSVPAVATSYSTGAVSGGSSSTVGGFIGGLASDSKISETYWDLDTSGISDPHRGAGNIADAPGISGLTTEQFFSGLPEGFGGSIWKQNAKLNGGYPYLVDNPPSK